MFRCNGNRPRDVRMPLRLRVRLGLTSLVDLVDRLRWLQLDTRRFISRHVMPPQFHDREMQPPCQFFRMNRLPLFSGLSRFPLNLPS